MMNIEERMVKYRCEWLKSYLKELLVNKDLKTYNRVKCLIYYFPSIITNMLVRDFKIAMKYANETYICLGEHDLRYPIFDKIYKERNNGSDFEPSEFGETRYITIEDFCNFFKL